MSETRDPSLLFLDRNKVRFLLTAQEPSDDIPFMDLDFEVEGDLRSQACLAYSFEKQSFYAQIRQSETDDGMFEDAADATKEQTANLLDALPAERKDRIAELQAYFNDNKAFPQNSLRP